jgi:2-dehydro-3-deoxygluconokinase
MTLCFGELLLRLQPHLHTNNAAIYIGGAEANVAASLAAWKSPVQYVSVVPRHSLTDNIIQQLISLGIDCSKMLFSGERIGTYYLPQEKDMKSAGVIYDRKHSAFAQLKPNTINWNELLTGVQWLHWSAITPAIDVHHPAITEELLFAAKQKGITISVDLNYRSKLWQYCKAPSQYMHPLMKYCDVVMGNLWAVESLLSIHSPLSESRGKTKDELIDAAAESMLQVQQHWPQVKTLAYTFRMDETYFGVMQHKKEMAVSKEHTLKNIIDKVGTGDSFMAALIYWLQQSPTPQQIIDVAAAAAVSKFGVKGDFNNTPLNSILQLASVN